MSTEFNIEFRPPLFLAEHFYISGTISVICNIFISYLLCFKGKKLDTFRYFLLTYQVFCAVGDIHLSVLMQPIGLFPITAGYSNGLLGQFLSVPVDIQMALLSLLASLQVNGLNICFLRKYKTIADMSSRFQLNVIVYRITVSILGTYPILFSGAFFLSGISKEEQLEVIRKEYPFFEQEFLSLNDFQLYIMNFWMSMYFFLAMFGCIQSGATIGISVLQMVRTLHEVKSLISKVTWKKHKVAVRNLILQFQSSLIGIVPAVSIAFVVVISTKYSQVLSYYFTMIVAIHSTCNAIVMMITYPELRKHAMFWKKPEISTISVSVTQNSSQRVRSIVQT